MVEIDPITLSTSFKGKNKINFLKAKTKLNKAPKYSN